MLLGNAFVLMFDDGRRTHNNSILDMPIITTPYGEAALVGSNIYDPKNISIDEACTISMILDKENIEKCGIVEINTNDSLNKNFISNIVLDDSSCAFPTVIDKNNTYESNLELSEPLTITELSIDDSGFIDITEDNNVNIEVK